MDSKQHTLALLNTLESAFATERMFDSPQYAEISSRVNSHDALVAALQGLADDYEDLLRKVGEPHRWGMITVQTARAALKAARE